MYICTTYMYIVYSAIHVVTVFAYLHCLFFMLHPLSQTTQLYTYNGWHNLTSCHMTVPTSWCSVASLASLFSNCCLVTLSWVTWDWREGAGGGGCKWLIYITIVGPLLGLLSVHKHRMLPQYLTCTCRIDLDLKAVAILHRPFYNTFLAFGQC